MALNAQILPSLLAADMGHLADECVRAEKSGADGLHLDIMDGHFVPNLSMGPAIVAMARQTITLPFSVHLMVERPDQFADPFLKAGANLLLIHIEAKADAAEVLRRVKAAGKRAGIVLNPETKLDAIAPVLDLCDEVLFMTVWPGFGGQAFIPGPLKRIRALRDLRPELDISVDGGITLETARLCAEAGANVMIAGTSLYRATDMAADVAQMRADVNERLS